MAKTFFNYSFQIKRTKTTLVIFIVVVVVSISLFITWYRNRIKTEKLADLSYQVIFGMNEFHANDCDKAYKLNYKKNTCGTICINRINLDPSYLNTLEEDMQQSGFEFSKISIKKIGNENWQLLKTKNNNPVFYYYSINKDDNTYTIEYVDQTKSLEDNNENKCNEVLNKLFNSVKISKGKS